MEVGNCYIDGPKTLMIVEDVDESMAYIKTKILVSESPFMVEEYEEALYLNMTAYLPKPLKFKVGDEIVMSKSTRGVVDSVTFSGSVACYSVDFGTYKSKYSIDYLDHNYDPFKCEHVLVNTGVPGGSGWCKKCDKTAAWDHETLTYRF